MTGPAGFSSNNILDYAQGESGQANSEFLGVCHSLHRSDLGTAALNLPSALQYAKKLALVDCTSSASNATQEKIWAAVQALNSKFRAALADIEPKKRPVESRKLRRQYLSFLMRVQDHLIEHVRILAQAPALASKARTILAEDRHFNDGIQNFGPETSNEKVSGRIVKSIYDALVRLGDLSRYRERIRDQGRDPTPAVKWHGLAAKLLPDRGTAYYQRGLAYMLGSGSVNIMRQIQCHERTLGLIYYFRTEHELQAVYNLYRAGTAPIPVKGARESLKKYLIRLESCGSSLGEHPLVNVNDSDWGTNILLKSLLEVPYTRNGLVVDIQGVRHSNP